MELSADDWKNIQLIVLLFAGLAWVFVWWAITTHKRSKEKAELAKQQAIWAAEQAKIPPVWRVPPHPKVYLVGHDMLALVKKPPNEEPREIYTTSCDIEMRQYLDACLEFSEDIHAEYWVEPAGNWPNVEPDYNSDEDPPETAEDRALSEWTNTYYPRHGWPYC